MLCNRLIPESTCDAEKVINQSELKKRYAVQSQCNAFQRV